MFLFLLIFNNICEYKFSFRLSSTSLVLDFRFSQPLPTINLSGVSTLVLESAITFIISLESNEYFGLFLKIRQTSSMIYLSRVPALVLEIKLQVNQACVNLE